ncbi:MAG TPA: c-type cytochrome [Steroidobacteraceae bacterium]|nr:c-type cytochrome [Steroidobacteraceae bacterium]
MVARPIALRIAALALAAALLCALCTPRSSAAGVPTTPELARGEHIARLVCSACHVVATDQEFPPLLRQATPAFAEIANRPGVTAESLQRFVTTTHWDVDRLPMSMPNPMLSSAEAQAVSRYIVSLRQR